MDAEQQKQLLKEVMIILDDMFFVKCQNSDLIVEFPTDSVRIKSICQYCGGEGLERECHEICEDKFYAFLSEEKESSETQEDSFAIKTFRNVQMAAKLELLLRPDHMNSVFTWKQIIDVIMSDSDEHNKQIKI